MMRRAAGEGGPARRYGADALVRGLSPARGALDPALTAIARQEGPAPHQRTLLAWEGFSAVATLTSTESQPVQPFDWGTITWLCNGRINPGRANPRHRHPNCEEHIFVLRGECDHSLGDEAFHLSAVQMLRIPQAVLHHAVNTGAERVRMVIAYSSPERQTVGEEPDAFR